jgi:hypothetical protein
MDIIKRINREHLEKINKIKDMLTDIHPWDGYNQFINWLQTTNIDLRKYVDEPFATTLYTVDGFLEFLKEVNSNIIFLNMVFNVPIISFKDISDIRKKPSQPLSLQEVALFVELYHAEQLHGHVLDVDSRIVMVQYLHSLTKHFPRDAHAIIQQLCPYDIERLHESKTRKITSEIS